ncbi:nucleoside hydrolase [Planctomycetales bacterium ZRK34]|nr:nucleoside hydrolase [Planctomycetales bacterium ZRK34]
MTRKSHSFALILLLLTLQAACAAPPAKIIFDTDIGNDCDDAMALAVIHALQSRGQCDLLAVTVTKDSTLAAPFVDAINTFYGRGDIPIGVVHNGKTPNNGKFLKLAAQKDDGKLRYPHDLLDKADAPEAVALLRRTLAAQPDHSVMMIQVGFSTNLSRLLDSKPDDASPLTGVELVKKKTTLLSIMAGAFTPELIKKHFCEYNVKIDVPTAKHLIDTWPTDIVFSGWEIGNAIRYPAASIDNDYKYVAHHPIQEAYQLYVPTPHERPCYDLTSALYAVEPDGGYFGLSPRGRVFVEDDGFTRFEPDPDGPHRYLTVTPEQVEKTKAKLVELCIQPPQK